MDQNALKRASVRFLQQFHHFLSSTVALAGPESKPDQNFPQATPNEEHIQHVDARDPQAEFALLPVLNG